MVRGYATPEHCGNVWGNASKGNGATVASLKSNFAFEGENCGVLVGITLHQEQKACLTTADNAIHTEEATEVEDAKLILNMLGITPDKAYQEKLRKERKKG